ncbi:MAG TPA: hypothetical protein PKA58_21450, partial [Polyangium sp.]|nr:hypothetical protein [Polyangium sp.]
MSNDGNAVDRSPTCVRVSVSIIRAGHEPARSGNGGDLAGLFGNLVFDLSGAMGLPRQTSSKANVQMVEELTDAIEYGVPDRGELRISFEFENGRFKSEVTVPQVRPSNTPDESWFPPDTDTTLRPNPPQQTIRKAKADLAATVQERRVDPAQGGLGLARLQSEAEGS